MLQPLRLLRLVFLFRVLNRRAENSMRGRITAYVATSTGLLIFSAALAVLDAERGAKGANITNFGDAVWWSVTTMSTVGYGDEYPVTTTGRLVAVALMIGGVALLGVVTGVAGQLGDRPRPGVGRGAEQRHPGRHRGAA